jgi:hypothetical protein
MQQIVATLRFDPAIAPWLLATLTLLCIAAAGAGLFRRARGSVLRAAAFAVLLAWLAGPTLVRETRQGLRDIALMVIDQSASIQVGNRAKLTADAAAALRAQAASLPDLELRSVTVPEHGQDGTQLWSATKQALADIPADRLAGVVALTDGQISDLPPNLPSNAAPLHALIPAKGEEWDRRVRVLQAPSYGIVGHSLDLRVVVEDLGQGAPGYAPTGTANLTVSRDGATPETRTVPVGEVQTVPVDIARAGPTIVEFATDPQPGEASPLNNRAVVQINGVRDRLRVLLVSGEPTQDERTWRRLLKSDPAVDLVHFTILRPPEKDDTTPLNELALIAFPTRELFSEKLSGFDLIILDRFTDRGILPHQYLQNIAEYVRRGGALLLTAGPEFATAASLDDTPLSAVLPAHAATAGEGVLNGQFRPKVTALGARHPVTAGLPGANGTGAATWGPWYRAIATEDVSGQVLMTGPNDTPLLVLSHVGEGRAALLASDQIWLWSRGHMGGGPQAELLRRVAHWLMGEPELDEERLSARIEAGKLTVDRRSIASKAATPLTVTPPEGAAKTLAMTETGQGSAQATMKAAAPGVWRVSDGTHTAFAAAGQDDKPEFADLRATAEHLAPLVHAADGGTVWLAAAGPPRLHRVADTGQAAGTGWIGLRRRGAHLVTGIAETPLLPPWAALPMLLALVVAAWRRESA